MRHARHIKHQYYLESMQYYCMHRGYSYRKPYKDNFQFNKLSNTITASDISFTLVPFEAEQ